jgi:lysophospholipase L1-like esterase
MKKIVFLVILVVFVFVQFNFLQLKKYKWIPFNDNNISYSGAFIPINNSMIFAYSGCNFNFKTNSKNLILFLKDFSTDEQNNYVKILVNQKDTLLKLFSNVNKYDISKLLTEEESVVKIFKLTEASVGKIEFEGLKIDENSDLLPFILPKNKIVWIGNSVTCGYGNEVSIYGPPKGNPNTGFHSKNQNNFIAWGSVASRICNSQSIQLCFSGKGLYRNFDGSTELLMHQLIQKAIPQEGLDLIPTTVIAPIYVIHAGTNDFGYEGVNPQFKVDSALFISGLHKVFKIIQTWNPSANVIVVSSNMISDFYPKNGNKRLKTYLNSAIQQFSNSFLKFHFLELAVQKEPYGENWHPSSLEHQRMANQIVPILQNILKKQ